MTALMIGDLGSYFNHNNFMLFLKKRKQNIFILFSFYELMFAFYRLDKKNKLINNILLNFSK